MLPIVAVQIAPAPATPALEEQLLRACSAGLERARCVPARSTGGEAPRGVAVVSWTSAEHASIEVGLARGDDPVWVSRELDFVAADPESERWRAVGFTIALLADDPRFWPAPEPEPAPPPPPPEALPVDVNPAAEDSGSGWLLEARGIGGSGVVSGPMRWGGEMRLSMPLSAAFFATASVDYALARDTSFDVRWLGGSLGAGLYLPVATKLDARVRVELLGENVSISVRRDAVTERRIVWLPGVSLGGDLLWSVSGGWFLSARADAFWVAGSTTIVSAEQELGVVADAGLVLGLGAGYRF